MTDEETTEDIRGEIVVDVRVYGHGDELLMERENETMTGKMELEFPPLTGVARVEVDPQEVLVRHE